MAETIVNNDKKMNVYQKISNARKLLQKESLKQTGHNKFAGYDYFTLDDIVPAIVNITCSLGLLTRISFSNNTAILTVFDCDNPSDVVEFESPISECATKGLNPIQNLGSMQTYMRRYLLMLAFEIVDTDSVDNQPQQQPQTPVRSRPDANFEPSPRSAYYTTPTPPPNTSWTDKVVTEKQIKRLYAIAKGAGYDFNHVRNHVGRELGMPVEQINQRDYDLVVNHYQNLGAGEDEDLPFN